MITILVSAIGTGAGWNLADTIKKYFSTDIRLIGCDINPKYLVAASNNTNAFYQVTPISSPLHKNELKKILINEKVDYFIPIIDDEIYMFPSDDSWLNSHHIQALTVPQISARVLSNKKNLYQFLQHNAINIPQLINDKSDIDTNCQYFMKPINGHGSLGAKIIDGYTAADKIYDSNYVIQEKCSGPEITVDVFVSKTETFSICRERIEIKSGVCTKAKVWHDETLHQLAKTILGVLSLPRVFCFQVMQNQKNEVCVTDINPRLGAGTSMGSVCGWDSSRALISSISGIGHPSKFLLSPKTPQYVTRVYQDILMDNTNES